MNSPGNEACEEVVVPGGKAALDAQAVSRIVQFLTTALSFLPRICFVAMSAAAYGRLQHRSLASVAAAFD